MYILILIEKIVECKMIGILITEHEYYSDYLPRLKTMEGILSVGNKKIDLTHVTDWKVFARESKMLVSEKSEYSIDLKEEIIVEKQDK